MGKTTEPEQQAGVEHIEAVEALRMRAWELHLRGVPKLRIAEQLGVSRNTVARLIAKCYAETAAERRASLVRKQNGAIARMRRLQEQAWADHDADDERERSVLALMMDGASGEDDGGSGKPRSMVRYQSQRSQYLRVILDAEKEISRLEGVYEATDAAEGAVVFRVEVAHADGVAARTRALAADGLSPAGDGDDAAADDDDDE